MDIQLSVIIPIYNTGDIIENNVRALVGALDQSRIKYEILVHNDGSADDSGEKIKRLAQLYKQLRFTCSPTNQGLGVSLQTLLRQARGKGIVYCDCDLPFGAQAVPVLYGQLAEHDIAVASRYGRVRNRVHWLRNICSRIYYYMCRLLFNFPVADIGSGTVAMKRDVLEKISLKCKGFGVHAELYWKAARKGLSIAEIPFSYINGEQRSFSVWKHGWGVFTETIRLKLELN